MASRGRATRRWLALAAGVLVLALLVAAAPAAPEAYDAPVPPLERARNAALLAALASAGIERAWVDTDASCGPRPLGAIDCDGADAHARVLVVLEPPAALAPEDALRYALGAAAVVVPDAQELVARTTEGLAWRVEGATLRAYQEGAISRGALEALVDKGAG